MTSNNVYSIENKGVVGNYEYYQCRFFKINKLYRFWRFSEFLKGVWIVENPGLAKNRSKYLSLNAAKMGLLK
jgi:hypothetical protein